MIDVEALARRLAGAASDRRPIPMLSAAEPGLDNDAAYRVQRALVDLRVKAGAKLLGAKLGLVSRAKQEAMGVAEPVWGWLTDDMLHEEDAPLALSELIHPRAEPEIAFLLGQDVPADATAPVVLAATAGVFAAIEVLDSRYEDFKFTAADVIADNTSAARIVLGGRLVPVQGLDLQLEGMVLRVDGEVLDTAAGAAIAGSPAAAVAWLARQAGGLSAKSIVLSGGLTAAVPLRPSSVLSAEFANIGRVCLRCGA
ncbi:MAG: 2-keto-4-pentenoate hydratase [Solirubrobacteraceae bacterium]